MFDVGFQSVEDVEKALLHEQYLPDRALSTSVFLAATLQRPLLLEGEAGVGKTELAKVLARIFDTELIRLQCYEGIDVSQALYEWDYARQVLYTRVLSDDAPDEQSSRPVDEDLLGGFCLRVLLGSFDELAGLEGGAGADEGDQV
uniref:AAA family ATPase n=1 Tax=Pseudonocardia sp. H11422 TaxID=2835866 RepID=UPI001BDC3051